MSVIGTLSIAYVVIDMSLLMMAVYAASTGFGKILAIKVFHQNDYRKKILDKIDKKNDN